MARFDRIRAIANENPPADERLIGTLAEISPDGDLLATGSSGANVGSEFKLPGMP